MLTINPEVRICKRSKNTNQYCMLLKKIFFGNKSEAVLRKNSQLMLQISCSIPIYTSVVCLEAEPRSRGRKFPSLASSRPRSLMYRPRPRPRRLCLDVSARGLSEAAARYIQWTLVIKNTDITKSHITK